MQNYVFSIGLIPVQEFIAEARRSRDLRSGSGILSYLMVQILKSIKEDLDAKIIVPVEDSFINKFNKGLVEFINHADYSIPNRASGYCVEKDDEDLKTVFARIQNDHVDKFWENHLINFKNDLKEKVEKDIKKYFGDIRLTAELPFHLIWIAIPVDSDFEGRKKGGKVEEDLRKIGELFDNVKNTRPIKQWTNGATIGKCTQCGKREAICPQNIKNDFQSWWKWYQRVVKHPDINIGFKFQKTERLCDLCVFKRLLSYESTNGKFPSTNVIAIKHWFKILSENWTNELNVKYACFEELFNIIRDDQELVFYKKDHKDIIKRIKELNLNLDEVKIKRKFKDFFEEVEKVINGKMLPISSNPSNYLSVIVYDGDDMGKNMPDNWQILPVKLFKFQKEVQKIIEQNDAEAFYTGGDEGLILCPIETTLRLAIEIREEFDKLIRIDGHKITLSMGIIIFDRSRPMGTAIRQAQQLLDQIKKETKKDKERKNALAIGVQTASGNHWFFRAHWGADWDRIEKALVNISKGALSKGWAFDMEEFARSMPEDVMENEDLRNAMISELKRISWRKFDHKQDALLKTKKTKEDAFKLFWRENSYSHALNGDNWLSNLKDYEDLQLWANQFHLIGFLSKYHIV